MIARSSRRGLSLIELLIVLAILSILTGLTLTAVQRARVAAARAACGNNLHQIGLALQMYHDRQHSFPPGMEWSGKNSDASDVFYGRSWHVYLLPNIEQAPLAAELDQPKYLPPNNFWNIPNHPGLTTVLSVYCCPADPSSGQTTRAFNPLSGYPVSATTSYLGVEGTNLYRKDGVLFCRSRVRLGEISDGASLTLLVGERPAYPRDMWGLWYTGRYGQVIPTPTGSGATVLGVRERFVFGGPVWPDGRGYLGYSGEAHFVAGDSSNPYHAYHFWSWHGGGANFLFVDGSVRFLPYAADTVLPALATRAGGEAVSVDW
jgi:prepilin-type N-terminal cleavage/methylation domain-containing protein/prepilin-type processing-associated H-X9-DG protein